jgi:3-deoxy-7-phosphoheptulonate synthase
MLANTPLSNAATKRKRSELQDGKENDRHSITINFHGRTHRVTWFHGTGGDEIERHIRKKLMLPKNAGQLFLHDPKHEDMDVVISKSLPNGSTYNATVVKDPEAETSTVDTNKSNFKQADSHSDVRISKISPLIPPALLLEELPCDAGVQEHVRAARAHCANIVKSRDDRLLVIVGPCSIHDPAAALDYAKRLVKLAAELKEDLFIVMRVYFEKPRTTVGWKGLINDPDLNETFNVNKGLRLARQLLLSINQLGLPCGCEFLDTISPQFTADLVSWGAIGARTTESQLHRELTSGLSMPVGFKNSTAGDCKVAMDAVTSSSHKHCFLGITSQGLTAIVQTAGNPDCHVILRGGSSGPNYNEEHVAKHEQQIAKSKMDCKLMIDCSHANSQKLHNNQPIVSADVGGQVAKGNTNIIGVMVESNLVAGAQKISGGKPLVYGQSVTDACVNWDTTVDMLKKLAADVRARRLQ